MNKPEIPMLFPGMVNPVPRNLIDPDPNQPRTEFDAEALQALADDIQAKGITDPLRVYPTGLGRFILVDGERRWRASERAGLVELPCLLEQRPETDDAELQVLIRQAASSILRQELSVVDKARLYKRLHEQHGIKMADLPDFIRRHHLGDYERPTLSNMIRMLELPEWCIEAIRAKQMPASAAKVLLQTMPFEKALEDVRWNFESDENEEQPITEPDVREWCEHAVNDLGFVRPGLGWRPDAPYYDVKAHAEEVGLVKVGDIEFITNLEAHDRLNREHPKPHPNSPAAQHPHSHGAAQQRSRQEGGDTKAPADKPQRTDILDVRNRETMESYLIEWWRAFLSREHGRDEALINAVVEWSAFGSQMNHEDYTPFTVMGEIDGARRDAAGERKLKRLRAHLGNPLEADDRVALFDRIFPTLGKPALIDIVKHYGHELADCYEVDEAYLKLHTRATLTATVKKMGAGVLTAGAGKSPPDPDWTGCKKLVEMQQYCLGKAATWRLEKRVPKDLVKVWGDMVKRVK